MAQKITRGTLKRFEVYITDLTGIPQNPADGCVVTLIKQGEYGYDSPKGPYVCTNTGEEADTGYWGANVHLSRSMTLGNWVAHFEWLTSGVKDGAYFNFIVIDKIRPYINTPNLPPNIQVVG